MSGSCKFEGCTVDETGICALERSPSTCSNRFNIPANTTETDVHGDDEAFQLAHQPGSPVLDPPERSAALPSSRALGLEDLNTLMGSRYVNVVGILGEPESGKTACLASLYLLVSHSLLKGWSFADSRSLMAFEGIARGARDWNEGIAPEQMTVRTELADDHGPGFLHLRLVRCSDGRRVDLALPDIPGEWTQALVTSARTDRLEFMKAAEVIWVMVDGRLLAKIKKRQGLIARVGQLLERVKTLLEGRMPRLMLVITHRDICEIDEDTERRLHNEFRRRGANPEIVSVASFSVDPDNVPAGLGIADLVDRTVGKSIERPIFWQLTEPTKGSRSYLSYRRNR